MAGFHHLRAVTPSGEFRKFISSFFAFTIKNSCPNCHRYIGTQNLERSMENHTPVPIEGISVVSNHNDDLNQTKNPRKGKLVGPKRPFKAGDVWEIRQFLKLKHRTRDLALFNLGIDSKLRACDLLDLRVSDIGTGQAIFQQATIVQKKTEASVTFEITGATRLTLQAWIDKARLAPDNFLWSSRNKSSKHLSMSQYTRIIKQFAEVVGADPVSFATHSIRRTKVTLIYRQTQNLRACQLLLGHKKIENTVRYLGLDLDDALKISRDIDI